MQTATAQDSRVEIDGRLFNPFSPEFIREPAPVWRQLVADYPLAWHRDLRMWVVSSHALCAELLKNGEAFSPNFRLWEHAPPDKPEAEKSDYDRMTDHSLFMTDRRGHLRLRKLTMPAFSRPVMAQIDEKIRDLVVGRFDEIGAPQEFDVYSEIAQKLPARAIARMVGVPPAHEKLFHRFSNCIVLASRINLPPAQRDQAMAQAQEGIDYFKAEIARRRALDDPGEDFIGSLISAKEGDDSLSDWDILSIISSLITAGSDTAIDLHTYLIQGLLSHPEQLALLKAQPELMENAIIELLRVGAMGKFPFFRFVADDIDFHGQPMRRGQAILVNLSAAWRDPAQWGKTAEELDIQRKLDGNLVFGAGAHFCIGTYLVRVQAMLMLNEFLRRFPDAQLADGDGRLDYDYAHHNARRINRLVVKTGCRHRLPDANVP